MTLHADMSKACMNEVVSTDDFPSLTCVKDMYIHGSRRLIIFARAVSAKRVYLVADGNSGMVDATRATLQMDGPLRHGVCAGCRHVVTDCSHMLNAVKSQ